MSPSPDLHLLPAVSIRVAIADDSALFREGLVLLLRSVGVGVNASAGTAEEIVKQIDEDPPDVAVFDAALPPTFTDEGLAAALDVRRRHPGVGVLMLTGDADPGHVERFLGEVNARGGYMIKKNLDVTSLHDALNRISTGQLVVAPEAISCLLSLRLSSLDRLTERERDVLRLVAAGRSNLGIAHELYLSPRTVEVHLANIFSKLDLPTSPVGNRRVLAALAWLRHQEASAGGAGP